MSGSNTWMRRVLTVPGYLVAWSVLVTTVPLWLPLLLLADVLRPRPAMALRCAAFLVLYLTLELAGLLVAQALSLRRRVGQIDEAGWLEGHFRLQTWWAGTLLEQLMRLFRMRLDVEGTEEVARGPFLLFIRHSSIADTLLASLLVAKRHGVRLRYILKRELLWDPCLDVVGNRLPNVFVDRGATDSAREIERVAGLAEGLGSRDGVLIYPEGTRFSAAKRQRVLDRFESDGPRALHAYASSLHWSLPPRLGGPLALLSAAPEADVVFCAHVGFEPVSTLGEVWRGGLFGATVRVRFRRVPREQIPSGRAAQEAWLQREWAEQDQWLDLHARTEGSPKRK